MADGIRGHRGLVAVDVAGFSKSERSETVQLHIRAALYEILRTAFAEARVPWDDCYHEDRGDGVIIVVPADISMSVIAGRLVEEMRAGLRRHNEVANERAEIHLRVALHLGEVHSDPHGLVGAAVIHVFRLLDAAVVKELLARNDAQLVVIASDRLYQDVLRQGWDLVDPAEYVAAVANVKETSTRAWLRVPGQPAAPAMADVSPLLDRLIGWSAEPTPPMQLPATIRDFTGRQEFVDLIESDLGLANRSVTNAVVLTALSGKGGVGKTALAVHAAHRLLPSFPDGQLYVNLRGMESEHLDPLDVLNDFLVALGIASTAIPDSLDSRARLFRSVLAAKKILVVLDNAAAADQVRPLLPGSPSCAVLITSRVPLRALESATTIPIDVLPREHALELLGKLVGADRIAREPDSARQLVLLCGQLPLALRISGAKLAARPRQKIAELVARLDAEHSRLDMLKAGDLEVRASFALSYDGLSVEQQRCFRLLSVLNVSDFTSWTAARLLGLAQPAAEDMLDQLVDAQLIEEWDRDATDSPRFRYHDLLRLFARERLTQEDSPETRAATLRDGLGAYVFQASWADAGLSAISLRPSRTSAEHGDGWVPPSWDPLDWFQSERVCLITAVEQAYENRLWAVVVQLVNSLTTFYELRAHWSDARLCNELALAAARQLADAGAEASVLLDLGIFQRYEEKWDDAVRSFRACLDLFRSLGDDSMIAYTQLHLGDVHREQNQWPAALDCYDESLPLFLRLGDEHGEAHVRRSIGAIYRDQSRLSDAMACFEASLRLFRRIGDRRGEGHAVRSMGAVLREQGEHARSLECFTQSLSIFNDLGDQHWEAYVLQQIGSLYRMASERALAIKCLTTAIEIFGRLEDPLCGAQALRSLGETYLDDGDPDRASGALREALSTFERLGVLRGQAQVRWSLGLAACAVGSEQEAAELLDGSAQLFEQIGDQLWAGQARERLRVLRAASD